MKKQGKTRLGFLFLGLLFSPIRLQAASPTHTIQQNIFLAKSGDFIVFSRGSQRIFILVKSASQDSVCLEIIDFPTLLYSERNLPQETSWKTAIHQLKSPAKVTVLYLSKKKYPSFFLVFENFSTLSHFKCPGLAFVIKIFYYSSGACSQTSY